MRETNGINQYENRTSVGALSGLSYLLIGGGIGAALALLFAPKAGSELRSDISDVTRRGYDQTADLAQRVKEQSTDIYNTVKEKASGVLDLAASKATDAQYAAEETLGKVGDKATTAIHQIEEKFGKKDANSDSKSAQTF